MAFRALHIPGNPFVIPNPWDVGSARMFAGLGFPALASTSAGAAFAMGKTDGALSRAQLLDAAVAIKRATGLPINADLEHGGGNRPSDASEGIAQACAANLDGASIEDWDTSGHIFPFEHALARIIAAVTANQDRALVLTARTEIMLSKAPNFDEVLRRITAFAKAGADVLFAPGLTEPAQISAVVKAAQGLPVNVLIGGNTPGLTQKDLAELGVARISFGSGLARAAYGAALGIAETLNETGQITYPDTTASFSKIEDLISDDST